jgi:hypothetical protein
MPQKITMVSLTGQTGIHGFWESRLPELYFDEYDFFVGPATYLPNVQLAAWEMVRQSTPGRGFCSAI